MLPVRACRGKYVCLFFYPLDFTFVRPRSLSARCPCIQMAILQAFWGGMTTQPLSDLHLHTGLA